MAWTPENAAAAAAENWELRDTIDNGTKRVYLRAYQVSGLNHDRATAHIVNLARRGSHLHIEALRAIAHEHAKSARKPK